MHNAPRYLTPPEVADLLAVNASKVLAWIRAGELRATEAKDRRSHPVSAICKSDFKQARAFVPQATELLTPVWADADNQGGGHDFT